MILLHIITNEKEQAIEIVDYLVKEKLILDAIIMENITGRKRVGKGNFKSMDQTLIIGKTKALLFNTVDEQLREKYKKNMPVLYSIPIVNMDWEQANDLIKGTAKI
ncbi:hypothetical protein BH23BAC1_BH23BAC1_34010 [soil metagenome]